MKLFLTLLCFFIVNTAYADKIAIIGGGASGVVSAWLLEQNHEVTLYEADNRLGGHANSIEINVDGKKAIIDAGAEFFNELAYPHFLKLLRYYQIPIDSFTLVTTFYKTDGSDIIILPPYHDNLIEWKSLTPGNISRSLQMKIVIDNSRSIIKKHDISISTEKFLDSLSITNGFKKDFLYPLLASAWGVTTQEIPDFAAYNTMKYIVDGYDSEHYKWYEVTNGMSSYIRTIQQNLKSTEIRLNARVNQIREVNGHFIISAADGSVKEYDQIVFATDADAASQLIRNSNLQNASYLSSVLGQIRYYDTKIAIHGDRRFMPSSSKDWRVINIRYNGYRSAMTMYKSWKSTSPIFKTWLTYDVRAPKDAGSPIPDNLYALVYYRHAATDLHYFDTQQQIAAVQGKNHLWFAGAWTVDNDSHESAINSAIRLAEKLSPNTERLNIVSNLD